MKRLCQRMLQFHLWWLIGLLHLLEKNQKPCLTKILKFIETSTASKGKPRRKCGFVAWKSVLSIYSDGHEIYHTFKVLLSFLSITHTKLGHSVWNAPRHGTMSLYMILWSNEFIFYLFHIAILILQTNVNVF